MSLDECHNITTVHWWKVNTAGIFRRTAPVSLCSLFVIDMVTMTPLECQTVKHAPEIVLLFSFFNSNKSAFWTTIRLYYHLVSLKLPLILLESFTSLFCSKQKQYTLI